MSKKKPSTIARERVEVVERHHRGRQGDIDLRPERAGARHHPVAGAVVCVDVGRHAVELLVRVDGDRAPHP